ncbi:MAG: CsgG/HfaB family protein [Fibrobacterales bacterium]
MNINRLYSIVSSIVFIALGNNIFGAGLLDSTKITNVAVLPFTSTQLSGDLLNSITLKLMSELNQHHTYRVMERTLMNEILAEQGFQQSGACDESECAIEIGRLVAVDKIIAGTVSHIGNVFMLNVQIVDLESGRNEMIITREYDGPASFLISEFIPTIGRELSGVKQMTQKSTLKDPGDAFLYASVASFLKLRNNRIAFGRYLAKPGSQLVFKIVIKRSNNIRYTAQVGKIVAQSIVENSSGVIARSSYEGDLFIFEVAYGKDRKNNRVGYTMAIVRHGVIEKKQYVGKLDEIAIDQFHVSDIRFSPFNQVLAGAILPGIPQFAQERRAKGLLIGLMFWGSAGATYFYFDSFKKSRVEYKELNGVNQVEKDRAYQSYQTNKDRLLYASIATGVSYLLNLIDLGVNTEGVNRYNRFRWRISADAHRFVLEGDF